MKNKKVEWLLAIVAALLIFAMMSFIIGLGFMIILSICTGHFFQHGLPALVLLTVTWFMVYNIVKGLE